MNEWKNLYRLNHLLDEELNLLPFVRIKVPVDPKAKAGITDSPLVGRLLCHTMSCPEVLGYFHRTYYSNTTPAGLRDIISPTSWHAAYDDLWLERQDGFAAVLEDSDDPMLDATVLARSERAKKRHRKGLVPVLRCIRRSRHHGSASNQRHGVPLQGLLIVCPRCSYPAAVNRVTRAGIDDGLVQCIKRLSYHLRIERRGEEDVCLYRWKRDDGTEWTEGFVENHERIVPFRQTEPTGLDYPEGPLVQ